MCVSIKVIIVFLVCGCVRVSGIVSYILLYVEWINVKFYI